VNGWSLIPSRGKISFFTTIFRSASPFHLMGTGSFFLVLEQLEHEGNHLLPSGAKIKNMWSFISTPLICLYGMLLGYMDNFFPFQ